MTHLVQVLATTFLGLSQAQAAANVQVHRYDKVVVNVGLWTADETLTATE